MKRWNALVVDDQPEISTNLQNQLLQRGYEVRVANNFGEAMFMIEHYSFDIAILDIFLPDGNGISLFQSLKKKNDEIYTIMITGDATVENAITALNEGVNAFLVKPFSDEQLKANLLLAENNLILKEENRKLFQEIQDTRQFYDDLLNSTSEAILVVDLEFKIQFCNSAAQNILNASDEQLTKQILHQYIEDGYKVLSHIYQQLVLGKTIAGYRVGIKTADNKTLDAHLSADFLHHNAGNIEGLIINLSNTMIHDEVFSRILRKEKLSTIVNLANSLGHEIRNPINILYGRLQLLAEEMQGEEFDHAYKSIKRQIDRLLKITDLLSKFNFSREDSIPETVPVVDILQGVLAEKDSLLKDKKIGTNVFLDVDEFLVEGSSSQFTDAFSYLLDAMADFTPENKSVEIGGKIIPNYSSLTWLELQFIMPEVQISSDQLFDPYQSIDMKANGLVGLGMTIMHIIFTNYGAKIDSHIQNNKDTLIRIRFPLYEGKQAQNSPDTQSQLVSVEIKK